MSTVPESTAIITVYFMVPEAYSMFPGGDESVPIGGAGAIEYYLADALSQDRRFKVVWVYPLGVNVDRIHHPRIEIRSTRALVQRRMPIVGRVLNKRRLIEPLKDPGPRVVVAPAFLAQNGSQWQAAVQSGARPVLRVASDSDISDSSGAGIPQYLRNQFSQPSVDHPDVIVHSQWQQSRLIEAAGEAARSRVHLIRKGWASPSEPPAWEGRRHTLWVGSCRSVKQPHLFLALAQMFPDEQFVMVMPPFLGQQDELHREILAEAANIPNLNVIGHQIPIQEVDELFLTAKLYVNTSQWEGFANTFLQAGAAGTPVVSLLVDPDGYIDAYGVGAVANGSLQSLAEGAGALLADGARRARECGLASWRYVRTHHSMEVAAEQLADVVIAAAYDQGKVGSSLLPSIDVQE